MPGDREHRLAVELGVVQAVEQVDPARPGGREADAQLAGELGVAAGHERGRFLVAHLDEADLVLALAQRLHDPVDAVAGQAEDDLDAPVDAGFDQNVRRGIRHYTLPCWILAFLPGRLPLRKRHHRLAVARP